MNNALVTKNSVMEVTRWRIALDHGQHGSWNYLMRVDIRPCRILSESDIYNSAPKGAPPSNAVEGEFFSRLAQAHVLCGSGWRSPAAPLLKSIFEIPSGHTALCLTRLGWRLPASTLPVRTVVPASERAPASGSVTPSVVGDTQKHPWEQDCVLRPQRCLFRLRPFPIFQTCPPLRRQCFSSKSLFRNTLRVTATGSIFCGEIAQSIDYTRLDKFY